MTMTQQELENYLWGAANLLRGVIDPGDYKSIIFPLMFFKRLSDVYDEEYEDALQTYGDEESANSARITCSRFQMVLIGKTLEKQQPMSVKPSELQ